jgi:hypothetical protein
MKGFMESKYNDAYRSAAIIAGVEKPKVNTALFEKMGFTTKVPSHL